jgi:hypothetical protein
MPEKAARACGAIAFVPLLRMFRLARTLHGRPGMVLRYLESIPVLFAAYSAAAFGESAGYLFGPGDAEERFMVYELNDERLP